MEHHLIQHVEALIFITREAITVEEVKNCLEETFDMQIERDEVEEYILALSEKYGNGDFPFEIVSVGGGYKFMTKGSFYDTLAVYLKQATKKRLSRAALETLSLVAYKQPVTKSEIEKIRGVNCDYSIQKLLEKELVEIIGRSDGPGRPLVYGTGEKFMNYFGINDIAELPKLREFKVSENEIGNVAPIDEEAYVISLPDEEE